MLGNFTISNATISDTGISKLKVYIQRILIWNVVGKLYKQFILKWNITGKLYKQFILKWDIKGVVRKQFTLIWNVLASYYDKYIKQNTNYMDKY